MALFTCPECGNQVSDKAELCPNCGYPVTEFIAQERNKIEQQNRIIKNNKFKHKVLIIIIIIAIVCIIAIGVAAINFWSNQSEREGLYDGIEWGTKLETVSAKYPDGSKTDDENGYVIMRDSYEDIEGLYVTVTFQFENDELYKVGVLAVPDSDDIGMTHNQVTEYLTNRFTELYGDPVSSNFQPVWETSKSTVSISDFAPISSLLIIEYQDINYQE